MVQANLGQHGNQHEEQQERAWAELWVRAQCMLHWVDVLQMCGFIVI